jgi:pimeloyl-ACP methyl ester carboxylesterase
MPHTHVGAPTKFIEANGVVFAHRRFGEGSGPPLLLMQHFRAGMDSWDPAVTDGLAASREVILFDNAGVASSGGETPDTFEAMADQAAAFIHALGLPLIDLLGFSIGGYIAQALVLRHPARVRRLVLVGAAPRGGEPTQDPKYLELGASTGPNTGEPGLDAFLYLFFRPSAASQTAGRAFWERRHLRKVDADQPTSPRTMAAQRAAIIDWRKNHGERFADLRHITQPTLVVNGSHDVMVPTVNSFTLSQGIPNAQLIIYPDSGHGSLFQYPDLFVAHSRMFLDAAP